jgi:hypothetical protein
LLIAIVFCYNAKQKGGSKMKEQLLRIVRAFNKCAATPPDNTAALAQAQADAKAAVDALEAFKSGETLTDAENAEVQTALNAVSAATPPTPAAVAAVADAVPQGA